MLQGQELPEEFKVEGDEDVEVGVQLYTECGRCAAALVRCPCPRLGSCTTLPDRKAAPCMRPGRSGHRCLTHVRVPRCAAACVQVVGEAEGGSSEDDDDEESDEEEKEFFRRMAARQGGGAAVGGAGNRPQGAPPPNRHVQVHTDVIEIDD